MTDFYNTRFLFRHIVDGYKKLLKRVNMENVRAIKTKGDRYAKKT
jgi:hypothetical protein